MTLQASGQIQMSQINTELGYSSTNQRHLSQLYRNGGFINTSNINVPTSGQISMNNFHGASRAFNFGTITITASRDNFSLTPAVQALGWDLSLPIFGTVIINPGVVITSNATFNAAFETAGGYPAGSSVTLINNGSIIGHGGLGGTNQGGFSSPGGNGWPGGVGLNIVLPMTLNGTNGTIAGGGGGGGSAGSPSSAASYFVGSGGGGGGAGNGTGGAGGPNTGNGAGNPGANGTVTTPGAGGSGYAGVTGGAGGAWGQPGGTGGTGSNGGAGGGAGGASGFFITGGVTFLTSYGAMGTTYGSWS